MARSEPPEPEADFGAGLGAFGQRGLDSFGARLVVLFLITVLIGIPLAMDRDRLWWGPALALAVAGCAYVLARGLTQHTGPGTLAALVVVATAVAVVGAANAGAVPAERSDQITSWLGAGIAGGIAVSRGPGWGIITLASMTAAAATTQSLLGAEPALLAFLGPISYCLGGAGVHIAARRGFVTTERTISATASATAAQRVLEERWRSARNDSRWLHDTVLSTLTMLSHNGEGISEDGIRRACLRDLEILGGMTGAHSAEGDVESRGDGERGDAGEGGDGAAGDALDAALAAATGLGLTVRVHGRESLAGHEVAPRTAEALAAALTECLRNVSKHAGVGIVDLAVSATAGHLILVVVDEGTGFDPAAVPADRLGLLGSVRERIADVGGAVTIWSRAGFGTSVVIDLPAISPSR